jgi:hypothetical protein
MKTDLPGTCPLCGQSFPRGQLHLHIAAEPPIIRQSIMGQIKASHPGWSHELGACPSCWMSYKSHLRPATGHNDFVNPNELRLS